MNTGMMMGITMVLLVVGGSNLYLARRFYQFLNHFFPNLPFWALICLFAVLVLVLTLGFSRSMLPLPAAAKQVLGIANACWMGVFVYLLLFFLLADAAYLVVRLIRPVERVFFLAGALVLTVAVCGYGFFHATDLKQKDYDITIPGAEEMTVVLISDVHLGAVGSEKRLPEIVEKINALEPDLVCIAGDFFDSDFSAIRDPDAAAETLKTLSATYGVWACLGNHDAGSTAADMQAFLDRCNIGLLNDEYTVIADKLVLAGRLEGKYLPDKIIPFAVPKEKVTEDLRRWLKSKSFVPKGFFSDDQVEKLTGVYFPHWMVDCDCGAWGILNTPKPAYSASAGKAISTLRI